jgi:integrase
MSDSHPTTPAPSSKPARPAKPHPDFPLGYHPAGYWCKKIRGTGHYFGPRFKADDPAAAAKAAEEALKEYKAQKDDLHAGKKPRPSTEAVTVTDAANDFLDAKEELVKAGELSPRTWADYKEASELVRATFGKSRLLADVGPDDFAELRNKMTRKWGPHRVGKMIQCVRCLFKYAYDAELIAAPVRFGPGFKRPSKKVLRLNRAKQGPKLFTADEVRRLIDAAGVQMQTMILLGINCGFGNSDCGNLPLSALDLERGWVNYPRPKTGLDRRCPLWPETVEALKEVLARRKEPKDSADAGLVFVTKYGEGWAKDEADSPITKETRKLLDRLGIEGRRNFYALRHTFRTVADEVKDQPAADHIMGHETAHMSSVYRETIGDDRLRAVSDHVRAWLFPKKKPAPKKPRKATAKKAQ